MIFGTSQIIAVFLLAAIPIIFVTMVWNPNNQTCIQSEYKLLFDANVKLLQQLTQVQAKSDALVASIGQSNLGLFDQYIDKISSQILIPIKIQHGFPPLYPTITLPIPEPIYIVQGIHGCKLKMNALENFTYAIFGNNNQISNVIIEIKVANRKLIIKIKSQQFSIDMHQEVAMYTILWDVGQLLFGTGTNNTSNTIAIEIPQYGWFQNIGGDSIITMNAPGKIETLFQLI